MSEQEETQGASTEGEGGGQTQAGASRGWQIALVIIGAVLVFAVIVLIANAVGGGEGAGKIEGGTWTLVTLAGQPVLEGTKITARFASGEVSGSAGCNNYSGSYERSGSQLTVGLLITQMMECPEPEGVMEQEYQYQGLLQSAASYRTTGGQLEILNASGGVVLVYK